MNSVLQVSAPRKDASSFFSHERNPLIRGERRQSSVVRFGESAKKTQVYGLFVERWPNIVGGLGTYAKHLPDDLNNTSKQFSMDVLQPYLLNNMQLDNENNTHPSDTNLRATVSYRPYTPANASGVIGASSFQSQLFKYKEGPTTVYSIKNPTFFHASKTRTNNLYFYPSKPIQSAADNTTLDNPLFDTIASAYGQSAANFINQLEKRHKLRDFIVMSSDWHTGPAISQLKQQLSPALLPHLKISHVFHNAYDCVVPIAEAERKGLYIPDYVRKRGVYSCLEIALTESDEIMGDKNYLTTIYNNIKSGRSDAQPWHDIFVKKFEDGHVHHLEHPTPEDLNPHTTPYLAKNGFKPLPDSPEKTTLGQLKAFKKHNRLALQKFYQQAPEINPKDQSRTFKAGGSLKVDPNAVVCMWLARFNQDQKNSTLFLLALRKLLDDPKYKHVQVVLGGGKPDDEKEAVLDQYLLNDLETKHNVVYTGYLDNEHKTQAAAGADLGIGPSMYEPFGLSNLELNLQGAAFLGHGVDGLYSTIHDPDVTKGADLETKRFYKQAYKTGVELINPRVGTGYLMPKLKDIARAQNEVREFITHAVNDNGEVDLSATTGPAMQEAQTALETTLKRAWDQTLKNRHSLHNVTLQKGLSALQYVVKKHNRSAIIHDWYEPLFDKMVANNNQQAVNIVA